MIYFFLCGWKHNFWTQLVNLPSLLYLGRDRAQGEDGCRVEPDSAGATGITTGCQPTTYQGTRDGEAFFFWGGQIINIIQSHPDPCSILSDQAYAEAWRAHTRTSWAWHFRCSSLLVLWNHLFLSEKPFHLVWEHGSGHCSFSHMSSIEVRRWCRTERPGVLSATLANPLAGTCCSGTAYKSIYTIMCFQSVWWSDKSVHIFLAM